MTQHTQGEFIEASQSQMNAFIALRDEANNLEESVFAAKTLAKKISIRAQQKFLREKARAILKGEWL